MLYFQLVNLIRTKNHQTVIRGIAKLNRPNIYYVICGRGELENSLRNLSKELGIEDQVKLLGYRTDIAEICKVADIFCLSFFQGRFTCILDGSHGLKIASCLF